MKVFIDPERCQGHLRCTAEAPAIFDADDMGHGLVICEQVPPEDEAAVTFAVNGCPEGAIRLER